ncbi:MAG: cation transporter [bacterium]|nr:MAG: cation transporter [bacterium]
MVIEFAGGLLSGSLALISDSGHMLTDTGALALSLFALWLARRPADSKRTFGYYRIEILAALINGVFLWVMVLFIFREAYLRLLLPARIHVGGMMLIGALGLLVNLAGMAILHRSQKENLNVRAAFLHVLGDALGSLGVILAGLVILLTGWTKADPIAGILIGVLILYSSWGLIKEAVHILLEGSPAHIELEEVRTSILEVGGVRGVHDLHFWTLTPKVILLTAHVVTDFEDCDPDPLRRMIEEMLAEKYCIDHTTIQIEKEECLEEKRRMTAVRNPAAHMGHRH